MILLKILKCKVHLRDNREVSKMQRNMSLMDWDPQRLGTKSKISSFRITLEITKIGLLYS